MCKDTVIENFITFCENKRKRDNTIVNYRIDVEKFKDYLQGVFGENLSELELFQAATEDTLETFLAGLTGRNGAKASAATINRRLVSINKLYKFLFKRKLVQENIAEEIEPIKINKKPPVYLTDEEVNRIIYAIQNYGTERNCEFQEVRDLLMVKMLLQTGMRVSEVINLKIENVNLETGDIEILDAKGGKDRVCYMEDDLELITKYMEYRTNLNSDYDNMFLSARGKGKQLTTTALNNMIKKYAVLADIPKEISVHKLRHTAITSFYKKTRDIVATKIFAGHENISTTDGYVNLVDDDIREQAGGWRYCATCC